MMKRQISRALISLAVSATALHALAQPTEKPISMVVGFAAGGGTDVNARIIAAKLGENIGQAVVVENRPGAGSVIAAEQVARAKPDGATLLLSGLTTYAAVPSLYPKAAYNPASDFEPVALCGSFAMVLAVSPSTSIKTLKEFIEAARAADGGMAYGSAGGGSSNQLAMELLMQQAGIKMTHIPYKGSSQALVDLMSGQVPAMFIDMATAAAQIKNGSIRVIGIAGRDRVASLPDVPTIAEAGLKDYEMIIWQGIVAPRGTSPAVVSRLNREINKAMADPQVAAKLATLGISPLSGTPEQFSEFMRKELVKWTAVIKRGNIRVE